MSQQQITEDWIRATIVKELAGTYIWESRAAKAIIEAIRPLQEENKWLREMVSKRVKETYEAVEQILIENYEAAKSEAADESCFAGTTKKEAVIEIYEDLIAIFQNKHRKTPDTAQDNNKK